MSAIAMASAGRGPRFDSSATANSVKAPDRSGRGSRCALRSPSAFASLTRTAACSACLARRSCSLRCAGCDSLASAHSVRGDVARLPGAAGPFQSRPCRLDRQSERGGMKGVAVSTNPDDASTAGRRPRSAARRGSRDGEGFHAVGGASSGSSRSSRVIGGRHGQHPRHIDGGTHR
jgi:hypothetical protein